MNVSNTITLGDIVVAATFLFTVIGFGIKVLMILRHMERDMDIVMIEHQMLMVDFCDRTGADINKLPTRIRRDL